MTWKDPDSNLPKMKVQSVQRHLYLDGLSRNKMGRAAGCSTAMTAASASHAPKPSIHNNSGKAGRCRSSYTVPAKAHGKNNEAACQKK